MSPSDPANLIAGAPIPVDAAPLLTIVMPAYNEQDIIAAAVTEWHTEVIARLPGSRLLVIDDHSTDGTAEVLSELTRTLPRVNFLRREVNGGHGKSLRFGFSHITSQFVFQTDSDRQHLPTDFWRVWEHRDKFDFVFGVRGTRQDGEFRKFVTSLMRTLNLLLWQVRIADANCPFKLMRAEALAAVLQRIPEDTFIPMVMVSILARRMGFSVKEVPVLHMPRRGGTQSLQGIARWARVSCLCAYQLGQLRFSAAGRRRNYSPGSASPR